MLSEKRKEGGREVSVLFSSLWQEGVTPDTSLPRFGLFIFYFFIFFYATLGVRRRTSMLKLMRFYRSRQAYSFFCVSFRSGQETDKGSLNERVIQCKKLKLIH